MKKMMINDADNLIPEIEAEHTAARHSLEEGLTHAIKCGELLAKVKEALPHGDFGPWIKKNCSFTDRTARYYLTVARNKATLPKRKEMSYTKAIKVLTTEKKPGTPKGNLLDKIKSDPLSLNPESQAAIVTAALKIIKEANDVPGLDALLDRLRAELLTEDEKRRLAA